MAPPAALLLATLTMSLFWSLPANAHMGSLCVVEAYNPGMFHLTVRPCRDAHLVEPLAPEDAVGALRDDILQRISAPGHADADSVLL